MPAPSSQTRLLPLGKRMPPSVPRPVPPDQPKPRPNRALNLLGTAAVAAVAAVAEEEEEEEEEEGEQRGEVADATVMAMLIVAGAGAATWPNLLVPGEKKIGSLKPEVGLAAPPRRRERR